MPLGKEARKAFRASHPDTHRRGACNCGQHRGSIGEWNARASACWNHARTLLAREHPGVDYFRVVELQDGAHYADGRKGRQALHLHLLVWLPHGHLDWQRVQEIALAAGFGCNVDVSPIDLRHGVDAAAYITKKVAGYVVKNAGDAVDLPWERADGGPVTYRVTTQSRTWGLTHKIIREAVKSSARASMALRRLERGQVGDDEPFDWSVVFDRGPPDVEQPDALPLSGLARWRTSQGIVGRLPKVSDPD